ncbi:unnamed protein product [Cladocopium goreaui]|uniref:Uncharacterized protein n=1 Tax=Cladocopium goreaui TaxID=2562237 RepID=A0A9P1GP74_9DINO|nr:unnamed protein product [Cladocopium goreaui]|mmetsp:Transcript_17472/g.38584  ORF Transcript_17472/g.38584 Transcript_17472/m.38584 type:complete len:175 (-) Transcript_17472:7-531(-)
MENLAGPSFPRSSLRFQVVLHLDNWLTPALAAVVLFLLLVKPYFHRYPPGIALGEFLLMLLHPPVQALRSWFGTAGNKQERAAFMAVFLALSVWTVLVVGYFFLLQTCAIYLESILAGGALILAILEILEGGLAGSLFCDGFWEFGMVFIGFVASASSVALLVNLWPENALLFG